jgi:hypothetical protein
MLQDILRLGILKKDKIQKGGVSYNARKLIYNITINVIIGILNSKRTGMIASYALS